MFAIGLGVFTLASAAAALAPGTGALIAARAVQGLGAGIVAPLSLTLLSAATTPERRGLALGLWSGISGLGVALGPLVGGAVIEGISWQWIFWINVPVGLVLIPFALTRLAESHGPAGRLDLPGLALASTGLLGVVFGVVRGNPAGWGAAEVVVPIATGAVLLIAFVLYELRAAAPMLPMRFFRSRAFAATNGVSFTMTFGIFGSIFLLAQFFQTVQGYSPLEAGLRTLPWTGMPMLVAPIAGVLSDRLGSRPLMSAGLFLQAIALTWLAVTSSPDVAYGTLVPAFVLGGTGMALVFAPAANAVLGAVRPEEAGQASGATNAIRELGGVLGVAVLAAVFTGAGGFETPQAFVDGLVPALWVGAAVLVAGGLVALLVPAKRKAAVESGAVPEPVAA
jgi:EmrB/QacA subfamily drug resistance transporter